MKNVVNPMMKKICTESVLVLLAKITITSELQGRASFNSNENETRNENKSETKNVNHLQHVLSSHFILIHHVFFFILSHNNNQKCSTALMMMMVPLF